MEMFDFVNYTYSGIISVLSTLFGLAYPLILGCIEKIDGKYGSSILTERFKNESTFTMFKWLLIANLIMAVTFPFLMDGCSFSRILIAFQCIGVVWMVYYAFRLFSLIMQYYNARDLKMLIMNDFEESFKKNDKQKEALYFTQWSDLTAVSVNSADETLVQSVYDDWYNYVLSKREEYKGKPVEYDDYFYDAITRLNQNLCKNEGKPISVNNLNSLLNSLIEGDAYITDKTFNVLWRNLRVQMQYGREELIMAYWRCASSKYDFFLRELSSYDIDIETQRPYTEEEIALRNKQREIFLEFHIMLCSMLIQEKKYSLVERMLLLSNMEPPTYPLVPSRMCHILQLLSSLNEKYESNPFYFEQRYPMPNMYGITGGRIIGAANFYLALLVYRLYAIYWCHGVENVLGTGALPQSQGNLARWKNLLGSLENWLKEVHNNKELLETIHLNDFGSRLKSLQEDWQNEQILEPNEIIANLKKEIDTAIEKKIVEQPLDEKIINQEINYVKGKLPLSMKPYSAFVGSPVLDSRPYQLISPQTHLYDNTAFQKNTESCHVGMAEAMLNSMWQNFTHYFSSAFFLEHQKVDYSIDSSILFKAIDRLIGKSMEYAIVCFGIYLDYYLDQTEGLERTDNGVYIYKGTSIYILDCPERVFAQRVYFLKKTTLPKLTFKEPDDKTKTNLNEILKDYALWMNVVKVKDFKGECPKRIEDEIGDRKDKYCLFIAFWLPILHFAPNTKMTCLKVNYKTSDEGNWKSLDNIIPLQ